MGRNRAQARIPRSYYVIMEETKKLHELIAEALAEIREMRDILQSRQVQSSKLVDIRYIYTDLGISYDYFYRTLLRDMIKDGVLFQIKENGKYYARLSDFNTWKERFILKHKETQL